MKIDDKRDKDPRVNFSSISSGEVFSFENEFYMRLLDANFERHYKAVQLRTGKIVDMHSNAQVYKIRKVALTISE